MILICGGAKAYGAFGITKLADAVIQTAKSAVLRFSQNNALYLLFLLFSPELLAITNFMEVWWPMDEIADRLFKILVPPRRKNKQSEISRLKPTVFNFTIGCNSLRFDRSQTKFRDSAFYGLVPVRFLSYAAVCLYLRLFF